MREKKGRTDSFFCREGWIGKRFKQYRFYIIFPLAGAGGGN